MNETIDECRFWNVVLHQLHQIFASHYNPAVVRQQHDSLNERPFAGPFGYKSSPLSTKSPIVLQRFNYILHYHTNIIHSLRDIMDVFLQTFLILASLAVGSHAAPQPIDRSNQGGVCDGGGFPVCCNTVHVIHPSLPSIEQR